MIKVIVDFLSYTLPTPILSLTVSDIGDDDDA